MAFRPLSSYIVFAVLSLAVLHIIYRTSMLDSSDGSIAELSTPSVKTGFKNAGPIIAQIDKRSELGRAANGSLGFERVIVVGLKERYDRRDAMALQSSLTGIHVEYEDGLKGEHVVTKALPPGMDRNTRPQGYIGSWRAHLNAIRRVVDEGLSSALIIEDDVDWDIRILLQMIEFAKGTRFLTNVSEAAVQHSPYGDDWDILWPGHCSDQKMPVGDDTRYLMYNDETVAPKGQAFQNNLIDYPEGTRMMRRVGEPICTFAYAISFKGAQKIIAEVGMIGTPVSFDNDLAFMCRDRVLDVDCYTVEPPLFVHHRPAGSVLKDSDLAVIDEVDAVREKGTTEGIAISTRLNLRKLITGDTNYNI